MWGCFLMSGVKILHFLKDWWKSIPLHQNYTMALMRVSITTLMSENILCKFYPSEEDYWFWKPQISYMGMSVFHNMFLVWIPMTLCKFHLHSGAAPGCLLGGGGGGQNASLLLKCTEMLRQPWKSRWVGGGGGTPTLFFFSDFKNFVQKIIVTG